MRDTPTSMGQDDDRDTRFPTRVPMFLLAAGTAGCIAVHGSLVQVVLIVALCVGIGLIHRHRRRAKHERQRAEARRQDDLQWLARYLATDLAVLTDAERADVTWKLASVQGVHAFRHQLDDLHRLRLLAMIQSRELVCWLDEMSDEQQKLARQFKWDRERQRQSDAQLQANAQARAARRAAHPPAEPSPSRLRARDAARVARREAAVRAQAARDAEHEAALRRRGAAARGAWRKGELG